MKVTLHKSGKFYWTLQRSPHRASMGEFRYNSKIQGFDVQHKWVTTFYQFFLFWWILAIDITPSTEGMGGPQQYREIMTDTEILKGYQHH